MKTSFANNLFRKTVLVFGFSFFFFTNFLSGQTANNYAFTTGTGASVIDPAYTTIVVSGSDDLASTVQNIGFTFVYEGTNYTQFSASSNGLVRLGGTATTSSGVNSITTSSFLPKIMPFWDDLSTASNGSVRFGVSGTTPNQICVIDFRLYHTWTTSSAYDIRFQVRLYETTNKIELMFDAGTALSNGASCAIGGATSTNYLSVTTTTHTASNSSANDGNTAWPGTGRLYSFSPPPANPGNPTSNSPQCNTVTLTRSGSPPAGETWYWQGTSCGTSTALGSGATYNATSTGTYYIRSQNNSTLAWSLGCGSVAVVINAPTITGQPANASVVAGNGTANFIVTATGTGLTYQWEEYITSWNTITNGGVYSGATTSNLTITNPLMGMNGYKYRCVVSGSCSPSATSDGNATLTVTYCTPAYTTACTSYYIDNFSFNTLTNNTTGCNGQANNYIYYTSPTTTVYTGQTYNISMQGWTTQGFRVWIDYNQNGVFSDAGEDVYNSGSAGTSTFSGTVAIPAGATGGVTRLRIRSLYNAVPVTSDYCSTLSKGETEDYDITIVSCSSMNGGTASLTANPITCGQTAQLNLSGQTGGSSIQWQDSPDNITFTDISGATSNPYTTAAQSTGTKYFRAKLTNGGCIFYSTTVTLTINNIAGGTSSLSVNPIAHGGTTQLILSGQETGSTFIWQESTDNITFTDITGATTTPYTTAQQATGTKYFRAKVTKGSCVAYSTTSTLTINPGPCGACTRYISGGTNTTITAGEVVCIKFGDTYSGTVQINGGTLCIDSTNAPSSAGTFSGTFQSCAGPFNNTDEIGCGTVDNKGTIGQGSKSITMVDGTFYNSGSITWKKLVLNANGSPSFMNRSGGTLTLVNGSAGAMIMQGTNTPTFTNKNGGTAQLSATYLQIDKGNFTNDGSFTVVANGANMSAGTFANTGNFQVTAGDFSKTGGTLTNSGTGTVTVTSGNISVDGSGTHVTNSGTVTITNGNYTQGSGTVVNNASGKISVNGAGKNFTLSAASGNAFTNSGILNVSYRISLGISGTSFTNNLTVTANNLSASTSVTVTNNAAGTIALTTSVVSTQATAFTNAGTITTGASFDVTQSTTFTNSGTITTGTFCSITQGPITNSGNITAGTDFTMTQGPFTNSGNILVYGKGTFTQGGPHTNSGCVAIFGNYKQDQCTFNGPATGMGRFCVGGYSEGDIGVFQGSGNLDFCDNGHPAGGWDYKDPVNFTDNGTHCSVAAPACSNCDAVLPVDILFFTAWQENKIVKLLWTTATEMNNDYFSVERSYDGKNFESIGKIKGAGNSSTIQQYAFTDESDFSFSGIIYYRLKQVDFNGKYAYSPITNVNLNPENYFNAWYNPSGFIVISFYCEKENSLSVVSLYDILGRKKFEQEKSFSKGIQQIEIPAEKFSSGVFFAALKRENSSEVKKIMIQK